VTTELTCIAHKAQHLKLGPFVFPPPTECAGLGLGIPYLHNGEQHEYVPDFLVRLARTRDRFLILEPKGYDPLKDVKRAAAERWCAAVNAHGGFGFGSTGSSSGPRK